MTATLRPFDWRDLPVLHRYRTQGLCMDAALSVTRSPNLTPGVLLSYFSPATGIFTWICANDCDEQPLLGQITYTQDEAFARLTFLAPQDALDSPSIIELAEQLASQAGERGALYLLAEIDEKSVAFEQLRKAGFATYARQRIWRLAEETTPTTSNTWSIASKQDAFNVQVLYHNVVPGLVQQVEPLSSKQINGLVSYLDNEIIGYVDLKYGPRGIWAQPFIHPDAENASASLSDILPSLPNQRGRSVYLCVRTYQSWLEGALDELDAQKGPAQAVMVKRLAVQQRSLKPFALPQLEGQREITPVSQSQRNG
ncbi:MAG TPA: hypothetical protein DEH22_06285 [Chloroflexi bacterium]|nr:hypothetical protein [Chloroflexota bacterium]